MKQYKRQSPEQNPFKNYPNRKYFTNPLIPGCIFFLIILTIILISNLFFEVNNLNKNKKKVETKVMSDPENFYIHLNSDVHRTSPLQVGNSIGNFVTRLNRRYN